MTLWRKSSRSADTANCVEVSWRKSSRSNSTANCVEVALAGTRVAARDSKNPAPTIAVPASSWSRFVRRLRA
ncbi:DUF397 domain-containing protein [Saccharothrix sp. NRRL B-16314]|uniref:DUF397 domain-containing protein n=1 Tax=Saccharothrix sp. NRRL B-16314 TaxID=1463825 RepID=UPI0009E01161|nr:DUF397 domain-containing protein [Saccharothrix sp. NRRL B-16314]